jgi:hypothetical protein
MPKQSILTHLPMLGFVLALSCGSAALWASPLYAKDGPQPIPEYCAPENYRDFFAYFVRGYDDQKKEMRDTYTWEQIEIRNYEQTEQLLTTTRQKPYKAFRLGLDNDWIYVDRQNPHFHDQPPIKISRRKPGDAPIYYPDEINLRGLKPDPLVLRLKAQQYAKLKFRDVTDRSFRVDYMDVQYLNSPYAKPTINWIETSEVLGAYVFEHRNGCWYLTQDLRVSSY